MSIYLHPIEAVIWAISILANYALAWIVWFRPGQRRHDLFAYYCTFSALSSTAAFVASALNDSIAYTFIRGVAAPTDLTLALVAIGQCLWRVVAKRIKLLGGIPRLALDFSPYAMTSITIFYFFKRVIASPMISVEWVLILLSASVLWVISFATDNWKLQWRTREYGIAAGFLWLCSLRFFVVGLFAILPPELVPSLYGTDLSIGAGALLIWTRFFIKAEPEAQQLSFQQVTEVNDLLHNLKKRPQRETLLTPRNRRA